MTANTRHEWESELQSSFSSADLLGASVPMFSIELQYFRSKIAINNKKIDFFFFTMAFLDRYFNFFWVTDARITLLYVILTKNKEDYIL